jgi:acyl carrier protein
MPSFDADIRNRIVILVKSILDQNSISAEVTADAPLVDVGLTSMDMVNLMLGVEAEFDFTIPQDKITPENFQSVATLERMRRDFRAPIPFQKSSKTGIARPPSWSGHGTSSPWHHRRLRHLRSAGS